MATKIPLLTKAQKNILESLKNNGSLYVIHGIVTYKKTVVFNGKINNRLYHAVKKLEELKLIVWTEKMKEHTAIYTYHLKE